MRFAPENGASRLSRPLRRGRRAILLLADDVAQRHELRLERREVRFAHAPERRGDPLVLDDERVARHVPALIRKVNRVLATVRFGRPALDEPGGLETVEQPRDIALCHIEALGEFLLADAFRLAQGGQHVALRNRDADGAQPLADRRLHARFQPDEAEPDPNRALGRVGLGH